MTAVVVRRLALRRAWSERWSLLLAAGFVSLVLMLALAVITQGEAGNGHSRFRFDIAGSSSTADPPPGPLGRSPAITFSGYGSAYRVNVNGHTVDTVAVGPTDRTGATAPAGSRAVTFRARPARLIGNLRTTDVVLEDLDLGAPGAGLEARLVAGRAPRTSDEVAIAGDLVTRLRSPVGSVVSLGQGKTATVVGTVQAGQPQGSASALAPIVVVAPDSLAGTGALRVWLLEVPAAATQALAGGGGGSGGGPAGPGQIEAYSYAGPDGRAGAQATRIIAAGVYESILLPLPLFLTAAILAIGTARRARELRLLALAGASDRTVAALAMARGVIIATVAFAVAVLVDLRLGAVRGSAGPIAVACVVTFLPAVLGCVIASRTAARAALRLTRGSQQPNTLASTRPDAIRAALLLTGAVAAVTLAAKLDVITPIRLALSLAGATGMIASVAALARVAVALPSAFPLPIAARAAVRAVSRARWVSAPAAAAVALAALVVILFIGGLAAGSGGSSSSGAAPTGAADIVAIAPDTLSDPQGTPLAPQDVVRSLVPDALAIVRLDRAETPIDGVFRATAADLAKVGLDLPALAPDVVVDVGSTPSVGGTPSGWRYERVPKGWPTNLPTLFSGATGLQGTAPTWLVRLPAPPSTGQLRALGARVRAAGLAVQTGRASDQNAGLSDRGRLALLAITVGLALLFGSVATALVLAERRDESRRLVLAGARPRDLRVAAASTAFGFGVAAVALTFLLAGFLLLATALYGGAGALLRLYLFTVLPLAGLPFLLALGTLILHRTPTVGRLGRMPRDASGRRASGEA